MKLAALLPLIAISSQAATYFVAATGDNSAGDGSSAKPWRTIQYGVNQLSAGDTLIVRNGDYAEYVTTLNSGASGAPVTIKAENRWGASTRAVRVNDTPWYVIQGMHFKGAQNLWGAHLRVENNSHNLIVSDCLFGPGVFAFDRGMVFNSSSRTVSNNAVDWAAAGFVAGGVVFSGGNTETDSSGRFIYGYANQGKSWTIRSVSNHVMQLDGSWVTETNHYAWAPINAGDAYTGVVGINLVPASSYSANHVTIAGNVFSNLWGADIDLGLAYGASVLSNRFYGNNGFKWITPGGTNHVIAYNLVLNATNFVHYSPDEIARFHHPSGGGSYYDYQIGFIHTGGTKSRNVVFHHNWLQNVHNPLGQLDDDPASTNLTFAQNVFVGIGGSLGGGCNGLHFRSNTFYRVAYAEDYTSALTLGSGGITNVSIIGNLFVDIGNHASTNQPFWGITGGVNVTNDFNFYAQAETMGFAGLKTNPDARGINGGDPMFVNPHDPLGPDGLPFTDDDGLRPMANAPFASLRWGALPPKTIGLTAHFRVTSPSEWQDAVGTNYNPSWWTADFWLRSNRCRPYGTPESLGTAPAQVAFSAAGSLSGTSGTNSWTGITSFAWDFGDGTTFTTNQPTAAHAYGTAGTFTVRLTVANALGAVDSTRRTYRVGGVDHRPQPPTSLRIVQGL